MPLFVCDKCGCVENTALGHYWTKGFKEFKNTEWENALCSECTPLTFPNGEKSGAKGKWHDKFPKEKYKPGKIDEKHFIDADKRK